MLLKRKPPPKQHGREVQIPALENLSLRPTAQCLYRNRCGEIPRMMVWALKELADIYVCVCVCVCVRVHCEVERQHVLGTEIISGKRKKGKIQLLFMRNPVM